MHGAIDDARGNITGLYFSPNECLNGYFEVKRQTLLEYGLPMSIYVDRHTIFKAPSNAKLYTFSEGVTIRAFVEELEELSEYAFGAEWWIPQLKLEGPIFETTENYVQAIKINLVRIINQMSK